MSFEGDGLDPQIKTIQPGGGVVMSLELAWGSLRRKLLRTFFPSYVRRMESVRQGSRGSLPFEPVDPRDLKYYRNQETYWWTDADDRYRWRDAIPFARAGLAELIVIGGFFLLLTILFIWVWWPLSVAAGVVFVLVVWFFRDPVREIPGDYGSVVSPADGKIVQIDEIVDPEIGPALQIGIFLSIFKRAYQSSLPAWQGGGSEISSWKVSKRFEARISTRERKPGCGDGNERRPHGALSRSSDHWPVCTAHRLLGASW